MGMSALRKRMLWLTAVLLATIALWFAVRQRIAPPRASTAASKLDARKIRAATLTPDASTEAVLAVATQVADAVATAFPADARALNVQAQVQQSLGRHAEAYANWKKCVALDPENAAQYRSAVGFAAIARGDDAEAATAFREALEAGSQDPRVLVELAGSLMNLSRVDEAVALLEERIRHQAVSADALTTLGRGYLELGQCEQALSAFEMALRLRSPGQGGLVRDHDGFPAAGPAGEGGRRHATISGAGPRRVGGPSRRVANIRRSGFDP